MLNDVTIAIGYTSWANWSHSKFHLDWNSLTNNRIDLLFIIVEEPKQAASSADDSAPVDVSRLLLKVGKWRGEASLISCLALAVYYKSYLNVLQMFCVFLSGSVRLSRLKISCFRNQVDLIIGNNLIFLIWWQVLIKHLELCVHCSKEKKTHILPIDSLAIWITQFFWLKNGTSVCKIW